MLSSWILEALGAAGTTASPLQVAKVVWSRHEEDLRSAGDLLFTWQIDLRTTAEAMAEAGNLLVEEAGCWALPAGTAVPDLARRAWSAEEIATAVEGYLSLLQAEHAGRPLRRSEVLADITAGTGRTGEQLEAMMCNISEVVREHDIVPLASYRPRSNVPVGVRPAVRAALTGE
ncbi:hypothetical protein ncot_11405 [Nocardioides sp. JQ2195]|uniref:hypothetical protein n=1 Tax=Nocardioides sp. JQ2195 TaxID=2592334 RepID=UPI00143E9786|nr:hypothetical protein [Nocardioides sp. JQ2195]QIX27136.1 hypothetical protein ncot_11405 [Nocardioides sp. JQ2195]